MRRHIRSGERGACRYLIEGLLCLCLAFLVLSLICAGIAVMSGDPNAMTGLLSAIALIMSFFINGIVMSLRRREGGLAASLICSLIAVALLMIAELIIKRGAVSLTFLINCIAATLAALLGSAIVQRRRGKRRHRR